MNTLAIDTSLAAGTVAAVDDDGACELALEPAGGHARRLVAALAAAARRRGWPGALADAELVAVVRGPGAFTGLRVGVTAAKALAWALPARLVAVSGFAVVAEMTARLAPAPRGPLAVAFDAGRGDVYAAVVEPAGEAAWRVGPALLLAASDWLVGLPAGTVVTGPALAGPAADGLAGAAVQVAPAAGWFPGADAAAALARAAARAGAADDPATLLPEYLRPSYAEERAAPA